MTRKWPSIGVVLAVLWLFVRGVPLEPATVAGEFVIGLLVGFPIAYATRRFYTENVSLRRTARVIPWVLRYIAVFLYELITANVDVAYRVLAPSMPIDPDVVAIPLRVETDAAITTIANSITLTPGTLTMDHDPESNTLYVHAIAPKSHAAVVEPIRTWEDYALRIFDEPADPSDPPPPRPDAGRTDGGVARPGGDGTSSEPGNAERAEDGDPSGGHTDRTKGGLGDGE